MVQQTPQISIGRFAGLTGISANTLRRYDELGLLSPAFTDPDTGYRLYAIEQLDTGIAIRLLRDLDVPLDEVRALMGDDGLADLRTVLARHRERLVERHAELERALARVDAVLDEDRGLLPFEIALVTLDPLWVVSRRASVPRQRLDDTIDVLLSGLGDDLAAGRARAVGREIVLYHNTLQWYRGLEMEVCLPVEEAAAAALGGWRLPGGPAVRTVYRGPWDDIWQEYATLLAHIARSRYEVTGPVRESYLVDERDTDEPARYLTEIAWPVRTEAASSA